ncbi:MAG: HNH endonuclease signature motif containing protein [Planctomycetota bacterium]
MDDRCELCGRTVPKKMITLHHLRPKSRGGGPEERVPTCKPCHKQIHATFTNKQLAADYADIQALRTAEKLQPFLAFIRKQKPERNITVRTIRRRRR